MINSMTVCQPIVESGAEDEILESLAGVLLRMSGERVTPAGLRRAGQFAALRGKVEALSAYISAHAPDRARRRALLDLGFELLYRDLSAAALPASARALMNHAHRIPSVIDTSFPGYARAGLLRMVLDTNSEVGRHAHAAKR